MIPRHPVDEYQRAADPRIRSGVSRRAVRAPAGGIVSGAG
jgi:hypothetical protein